MIILDSPEISKTFYNLQRIKSNKSKVEITKTGFTSYNLQ